MNPSSVSLETGEASPTVSDLPANVTQPLVRLSEQSLSELSDDALDRYIHGCAEQFLAAQREYESTGCFACIGTRDSWWIAEAAALRERGSRPEVVSRMEKERGLA